MKWMMTTLAILLVVGAVWVAMAPAKGQVKGNLVAGPNGGLRARETGDPYAKWKNGLSHGKAKGVGQGADYFPIFVWLQNPRDAKAYKDMGVNGYIGLWKGPTEAQLKTLKAAGMSLVCDQNDVALADIKKPDSIIVGWMHGDEPDNAKKPDAWKKRKETIAEAWGDALPKKYHKPIDQWTGYAPPFAPSQMIKDYKEIKEKDPTRPVIINLSQGVAWNNWHGRGVRSRKPEDYPEYCKGADIVSFDIYPVCHSKPEVAGKLEYVPLGVKNLRKWTKDQKPAWACIECTRIGNVNTKITPEQMRKIIWMSVTAGAKGLVYFVHQFKPTFKGNAILSDPEMLAMATKVNKNIHSIAPILSGPSLPGVITTTPADKMLSMVKRYKGDYYIFLASESPEARTVTLAVKWAAPNGKLTPLFDEEAKSITLKDGKCELKLDAYGVAQYKIAAPKPNVRRLPKPTVRNLPARPVYTDQ